MLQKQAEENRKAEEKSGDALVDLGKIMEIARRIARGDSVPPRDEKKLMEYSDELYQMAKSAAMLSRRKKHKKQVPERIGHQKPGDPAAGCRQEYNNHIREDMRHEWNQQLSGVPQQL